MDMILILFVDDLLLLGEDLSKIENVKHQLGKLYQMKDLRPASSQTCLILFGDLNYQRSFKMSHLDQQTGVHLKHTEEVQTP